MKLFILAVLLLVSTVCYSAPTVVPKRAALYKADLIREARAVNINAPVALFAAQIHQESGWKPEAKSAYAAGLTQFTPDTAKWISQIFPELGVPNVYNPVWAIRAMVRYDYRLYNSNRKVTKDDCNGWTYALTGYNGGDGWNSKDRALARKKGLDASTYWGVVELVNSGRRPDFFHENRGYPKQIIIKHQPPYRVYMGMYAGPKICHF